MKRSVLFGAVAILGMVIGPAAATAGREKVEVCHQRDNGTYLLIEVATPALDAHMAHGDGQPGDPVADMPGYVFDDACLPVMPSETLFAVAYSDLDGVEGFDPGGDQLIAQVVDADGDGMLGAGDEVVMGRYPKNFEATEFGDFAVTSHAVTGAIVGTPPTGASLLVFSGCVPDPLPSEGCHEFLFEAGAEGEQFYEMLSWTHLVSEWLDFPSTGSDNLWTNLMGPSPSEPDATIFLERTGDVTDDAFIEVRIFVS